MATLPVVPDFAAGLAAAIGQLTTALRLPTGWVASPSLRWTPSGATLLVRWGPALSGAPGGGEKTRRQRRSKAQQRRSALRAEAHKARRNGLEHGQQQAHPQQSLRPSAPAFSPQFRPPPPPPTGQQQDTTAAAMEVVQREEVREGGEQWRLTATQNTADLPRLTHRPNPRPAVPLNNATLSWADRVQGGQLQVQRFGGGRPQQVSLEYSPPESPTRPHSPGWDTVVTQEMLDSYEKSPY